MEPRSTNKADPVVQADWRKWCRLCAKDDPSNTSVYVKNECQAYNNVLATAIGKYFWVNIKVDDQLSKMVCLECHTLINALMEFTERVEKVQAMFNALNNTKPPSDVDSQAVREKYGLLQHEWEHIVKADSSKETIEKVSEDTIEIYEADVDDEILAEIENEVAHEIFDSEHEVYSDKGTQNHVDEQTVDEIIEDETEFSNVYEETVEHEWDNYTETEEDEQQPTTECPEIESENSTDIKAQSNSKYANQKEHQIVLEEFKADDANILSNYCCSVCQKEYKQLTAYKRHLLEAHGFDHSDLPSVECKRCDRVFPTERQLLEHYRTHLNSKEKERERERVKCTMCDKTFASCSVMKRHFEVVHKSVRPYICDICGKALKTLGSLNEHKFVHTDECPFECPVCHRRFKNKARLKTHSDTHGNADYICNICGVRLNTQRTFNMHKRVHMKERQFKCEVCGAEFKRSKTLKAHLILHTGLRPYVCNFCGATFSNGSNCRMHKRKKHPEELAAEESQGKKTRTEVPLLKELQAATKEIANPRKVTRSHGGLSKQMRELLMAAEEREKRDEAKLQTVVEDNMKVVNCIEVVNAVHSINNDGVEEIICEIVDGV